MSNRAKKRIKSALSGLLFVLVIILMLCLAQWMEDQFEKTALQMAVAEEITVPWDSVNCMKGG